MNDNLRFLRNVVCKALGLFLAANLLFAAWSGSASSLGRLSLYNHLLPGRLRFPFGENSSQAYNLSLYNLDAMFAAHEIDVAPKNKNEYRVIVIGDSSVWGTLLRNDETLTGRLNAAALTCSGRPARFYNLGYPTISLTKDLMILTTALQRYRPDLILWPTTLEAFPRDKQLSTPLVANNADRVRALIQADSLSLDRDDPAFAREDFWGRTIIGQRRSLADLLRLQLYGFLWGATGIDQFYPQDYEHAQVDLKDDPKFHSWGPGQMAQSDLAFDVLAAGVRAAGATPVVVVNEPMLVSAGKNSDVRYNLFYPRWAYDQYRQWIAEASQSAGWKYLDLGTLVDSREFTNSAIHLTPRGEQRFADALAAEVCK